MKIDNFDYKRKKRIVLNAIDELDDEIDTSSFNDHYYTLDFEDLIDEINLLQENLKHEGFNLDKFMKDYKSEIYDDYEFTGKNAFFDTLLYYYDKKNGILGGAKLNEMPPSEYFIKYKYGYYTYDMGTRYLLQSYDNLDDYYKDTANKLVYGYLDENFGCDKSVADNCSDILKIGDGYIINIYLDKLYLSIKDKRQSLNYIINEINKDFKDIPHKFDSSNNILEVYINSDIFKYNI